MLLGAAWKAQADAAPGSSPHGIPDGYPRLFGECVAGGALVSYTHQVKAWPYTNKEA